MKRSEVERLGGAPEGISSGKFIWQSEGISPELPERINYMLDFSPQDPIKYGCSKLGRE